MEENFNRVRRYITHCSQAGIMFNEEKFSFGREELEYLGFKRPKTPKSIAEFPEPKDIFGFRSGFDLTNQVNCFHQDHTLMEPLQPFLKPQEVGRPMGRGAERRLQGQQGQDP